MPHVAIKIQRKNEADKPLLPDLPADKIIEAELANFCILEGGMVSGKASVSFHIPLPDGTHVIAQTSAAIFEGMAAALVGAKRNWNNNPL
jgi:hypothetical protein